jgi:dTDP-4-dehydrorhamnose 3,5-epimerase-like enzyme
MTQPIHHPAEPRSAALLVAGTGPAPAAGISGVRFLDFRTIHDPSGNLTPIEEHLDVPFDIRRVFFLYDVPGGAERGGHAHRTLQEVVVAVSGSFDVVVEDGTARARYSLNRAYYGLYLPPMVWMNLENFSSNSVALVLASTPYDESDYYRDRIEFLRIAGGGRRAGRA